jgi:hypothetical protein
MIKKQSLRNIKMASSENRDQFVGNPGADAH